MLAGANWGLSVVAGAGVAPGSALIRPVALSLPGL